MTLKDVFGISTGNKTITTSSQLRETILQEIRAVLSEDASPDKVDPERFPTNLSQVATDPQKAQELVSKGTDTVDKGSNDDVINAGSASFAVGDLKPSQSSMNIEKALSMALGMIRDDNAGGDLGALAGLGRASCRLGTEGGFQSTGTPDAELHLVCNYEVCAPPGPTSGAGARAPGTTVQKGRTQPLPELAQCLRQHPNGTPLRKNYAHVGGTYDSTRDAFIPPKPFASWVLNEDICDYESPVAYPSDGKSYIWDESVYQADNTKGWVESKRRRIYPNGYGGIWRTKVCRAN
mgnify:CR=1 FL=1